MVDSKHRYIAITMIIGSLRRLNAQMCVQFLTNVFNPILANVRAGPGIGQTSGPGRADRVFRVRGSRGGDPLRPCQPCRFLPLAESACGVAGTAKRRAGAQRRHALSGSAVSSSLSAATPGGIAAGRSPPLARATMTNGGWRRWDGRRDKCKTKCRLTPLRLVGLMDLIDAVY